ncbi:Amino acid transporter AVT1B [Coccomyxa sp. Obi]|nr:Amino acid transporter AVT1B [Coccomyxa sp. Obi]
MCNEGGSEQVLPGSAVTSGDLESAAESFERKGAFSLVEADCSRVGQSPAQENGSNLPEGLDDFTAEQVHVTGDSGFLHTLFNSVNIMCGVGLLATPYAAAQMGWLSLLLLVILGGVFLYTGKLLGRCMSKAPWILTYPDIGQHAFGSTGRTMVSILLYAELYLSAVEFLIMEGDNLSAVAPGFQPFGGALGSAQQSWVLIAAAILLPTVYLRNLSLLAYLSAAGVFTAVALTLLVGWQGISLGLPNTNLPLLRVGGIPLSIGLLSYIYGGHSLFPSLYTSMRQPKQYPRILDLTFAIVCTLYASMAVLGYLTFGDDVENNVTLSMQRKMGHAIQTHLATWITILSPFTKYALVLTPIASALEEMLPATASRVAYMPLPGGPHEVQHLQRVPKTGAAALVMSLAVRTALVVSTVVVALSLPFFAYMAALIGGLFGLSACVVVPALCYLQMSKGHLNRLELSAVVVVAVVGVVLSAIGTTNAIMDMVRELRD